MSHHQRWENQKCRGWRKRSSASSTKTPTKLTPESFRKWGCAELTEHTWQQLSVISMNRQPTRHSNPSPKLRNRHVGGISNWLFQTTAPICVFLMALSAPFQSFRLKAGILERSCSHSHLLNRPFGSAWSSSPRYFHSYQTCPSTLWISRKRQIKKH